MIDEIKKAAAELSISSIWKGTGDPVSLEDDFIYELYVLFKLVKKLKAKYKVEYHSGNGKLSNAFPKKPANKKDRPRFIIKNNKDDVLVQICAGTKINDIHGKPRAPDISIQTHNASESPDFNEVCLIHDAKYKVNITRITGGEFSQFSRFVEILQTEKPNTSLPGNLLKDLGFSVSGLNSLITNGDYSTEPDSELQRKSVIEVKDYYPGKISSTRP